VKSWKEAFCTGDDSDVKADFFRERKDRLVHIQRHFSRLGKLEKFEVTETPKPEALTEMIERATLPQFIVVTGLSTELTPKVAALVTKRLVTGAALTLEAGQDNSTEKIMEKLKQHINSGSGPMLVLDRYLQTEQAVEDFVDKFGIPQLVINVEASDEFIEQEFTKVHEADEPAIEDEDKTKLLTANREAYTKVMKMFSDRCASAVLDVPLRGTWEALEEPAAQDKEAEDLFTRQVEARLLPQAYVLVVPDGDIGFGGMVADCICTAGSGDRPQKYTIIDTLQIFKPGGHSQDLEESLHKALFTAEAPDCLPPQLWMALFQEAFAKSATPTGPFLITNFPTASSVTGVGPTITDQFCMLESIVVLKGILQAKLSEGAFNACCPDRSSSEAYKQQAAFDENVKDQIQLQYGKVYPHEVIVSSMKQGTQEEARRVCSEFLAKASEAKKE